MLVRSYLAWPLVFVSIGVGCAPGPEPELSEPEVDCAQVEVPGYHDVSIWPSCTNCHSSQKTGADRQGAPEGIDYDTYDSAATMSYLAAITVNSGTMPFTGTVTEAQKQSLYVWALCGTPE